MLQSLVATLKLCFEAADGQLERLAGAERKGRKRDESEGGTIHVSLRNMVT